MSLHRSQQRKSILITAVSLCIAWSANVRAATSPTSSIVQVFEMRASLKSDCTDPVVVFKTASPTPVDLVGTPTFGGGSIANGTYRCLMLRISDLVTVVPQSTTGACTAGSPVTIDIFSDVANDVSVTPEGTAIHATLNMEDGPWVYFSDSSQALASNNCFEPSTGGCACSGPCPMTAFTLSADQTRSLVINLDNRLDGGGAACVALLPPAMPQSIMSIR